MITLLGSLIGFIGAAFPDFLKMWRDAADRKHELVILEMQMAQQEKGHAQRLEEINVQADISESRALYQKCMNDGLHRWDVVENRFLHYESFVERYHIFHQTIHYLAFLD